MRIIFVDFIQLRRNNLLQKINFTIEKHFVINFTKNIEKHSNLIYYTKTYYYLHTFHKTIFKCSIGKL